MDPNIKALWLHDLRSGRIPQTTEVLNDGEGARCCLGVLSDIAVRHGIATIEPNGWSGGFSYATNEEDSDDTNLPRGVAEWCSIDQDDESGPAIPYQAVRHDPRIKPHHDTLGVVYLATLNDNGLTFAEIADLIEEYL